MKILTNKKSIKIISLLLAVIITTFSICPSVVYAEDDGDFGGKLFKPIFQLLASIGDLIIDGLQYIFIGVGDTKIDDAGATEDEGYNLYSMRFGPGVIFSNIVPGLDANFINPKYTDDNPYEVMSTPGYIYDDDYTEKLKKYKSYWQSGNATVDDIVEVMGKVLDTTINTNLLNVQVRADSVENDETEILFYYDYNGKNHCFSLQDGFNDYQEAFYNLITGKVIEDESGANSTAVENYTYTNFCTLLNNKKAYTAKKETEYLGTELFSDFCRRLSEYPKIKGHIGAVIRV